MASAQVTLVVDRSTPLLTVGDDAGTDDAAAGGLTAPLQCRQPPAAARDPARWRVLDPVIESFSRAGIFAPAIAIARARTNGACTVYGS
jgi:hypothetical protein